jgi:hypothetical protein
MPSDLKQIALVVFATLAAACSSTPATRTSPTNETAVGTAAPQKSAPQALAAAGDAPATTPPGTASDTAAAPAGAVDASLVKAGYSVMKRHGEVLYCRNEIITGQRIATRICLTAAQIQDEKQNVTKAKDLMNQSSNRCVGASCNN